MLCVECHFICFLFHVILEYFVVFLSRPLSTLHTKPWNTIRININIYNRYFARSNTIFFCLIFEMILLFPLNRVFSLFSLVLALFRAFIYVFCLYFVSLYKLSISECLETFFDVFWWFYTTENYSFVCEIIVAFSSFAFEILQLFIVSIIKKIYNVSQFGGAGVHFK